jgi:hypothetical protein
MDVQELYQALETAEEEVINLPKAIEDLCGGFVVVDNEGHVAMIIRRLVNTYLAARSCCSTLTDELRKNSFPCDASRN